MKDFFIKNVKIIDGSGAPAYYGTVHIQDQKIYVTDTCPTADTVIDGRGLTL